MIDQGCEPVSATEIVVDPPLQNAALPLIVAVGFGLTVTVAVPATVPVQFASLTAVSVYVVVVAGDTEKVYGDVVIPFTVTGVTPSV